MGGICLEEARNDTNLEMEIRDLPAGEGRGRQQRVAVREKSCFYSAIVEDFIAMGAAQAMLQFAIFQGELNRAHGGQRQPAPAMPVHQRKEESATVGAEGDWDEELSTRQTQ